MNIYIYMLYIYMQEEGDSIQQQATGTQDGKVYIWNLKNKEIYCILEDTTIGKENICINDQKFVDNGKKQYTCTSIGTVIQWDIIEKKKIYELEAYKQSEVYALEISYDEKFLLTGSSTIILWCTKTWNKQSQYSGHTSAICYLKFINNNRYFISGGYDDRYINIWNIVLDDENTMIDSNSNNKLYTLPIVTIPIESPPQYITVYKRFENIEISIIQNTNICGIWIVPQQISLEKNIDTTTTSTKRQKIIKEDNIKKNDCHLLKEVNIQIRVDKEDIKSQDSIKPFTSYSIKKSTKKAKKISTKTNLNDNNLYEGKIIGIRYINPTDVEIVRYSVQNLYFEILKLYDDTNNTIQKEQIQLEPFTKTLLQEKQNKKIINELNTLDIPLNKIPSSNAIVIDDTYKPIQNQQKYKDHNFTNINTNTIAEQYSGSNTEVESLLKRINRQEREIDEQKNSIIVSKDDTSNIIVGGGGGGISQETMLSQALKDDDHEQLERCQSTVYIKGEKKQTLKIIHNTLQRQKPIYVVPFQQWQIQKVQQNPNRGQGQQPWMKECIHIHMSYQLTVPQVTQYLIILCKSLEKRIQPFKKQLEQQGRVDLVLSQISYTNDSDDIQNVSSPNIVQPIVYEEPENDEDGTDDGSVGEDGDTCVSPSNSDDDDDDDDSDNDEDYEFSNTEE